MKKNVPVLTSPLPPPLALAAYQEGDLCHGFHWSIRHRNTLAHLVARVMVGQHRYVAGVIENTNTPSHALTNRMIDSTIAKLQVNTAKLREHRDGWLFQIVAWVAARIHAREENLPCASSAPHARPADKGFDGIIIQLEDAASGCRGITISEEKASDNGRKVVQSQVFPDFRSCENGERDTELMHEVTTVLEAHGEPDVDELLEDILWKCKRHYRISLAVSSATLKTPDCTKLFKGYDGVIPGEIGRRRAELLVLENMRKWMQAFSECLVRELETMRPKNDV